MVINEQMLSKFKNFVNDLIVVFLNIKDVLIKIILTFYH